MISCLLLGESLDWQRVDNANRINEHGRTSVVCIYWQLREVF